MNNDRTTNSTLLFEKMSTQSGALINSPECDRSKQASETDLCDCEV